MGFEHQKKMKNMGFNDEKPSMMTQLGLNQPQSWQNALLGSIVLLSNWSVR